MGTKISFRTNRKKFTGKFIDWVKCPARRYFYSSKSICRNEKSHHFDRWILHMEEYSKERSERWIFGQFGTQITNASSYEMYVFLSKKFRSNHDFQECIINQHFPPVLISRKECLFLVALMSSWCKLASRFTKRENTLVRLSSRTGYSPSYPLYFSWIKVGGEEAAQERKREREKRKKLGSFRSAFPFNFPNTWKTSHPCFLVSKGKS